MQPKKQEKESIVKREAEPESETSLANHGEEKVLYVEGKYQVIQKTELKIMNNSLIHQYLLNLDVEI